jgi:hypothetical protein
MCCCDHGLRWFVSAPFSHCAGDLQVVAEAMNCTANIAKGLRKDYRGAAMTLCPGKRPCMCAALWPKHGQQFALRPASEVQLENRFGVLQHALLSMVACLLSLAHAPVLSHMLIMCCTMDLPPIV